MTAIPHIELKATQRALREGFPPDMGLRVHRSISWIGRAERETEDCDARFVFLWIAFNAAYADERDFAVPAVGGNARRDFAAYFEHLIRLDQAHRIYNAIWQKFPGPIRLLMENRYVFQPFWSHHNGIEGYEDWSRRFAAASRTFVAAVTRHDTVAVLSCLFDRLYVLRNQIVHGGATWNGSVNRNQAGDGAAILAFLMPLFVSIMMEHPDEDWGRPFYPVVEAE